VSAEGAGPPGATDEPTGPPTDGGFVGRAGAGTRAARAAGSAARHLGVEALHGVLQIHKLLIDFAETRFNFFQIVGEAWTCVDMVSRRAPELACTSARISEPS